MTSTTSQYQDYNFYQMPYSFSQFFESNNEELLSRYNTGYNIDAKGDVNTLYYV